MKTFIGSLCLALLAPSLAVASDCAEPALVIADVRLFDGETVQHHSAGGERK